ncbi:MAG TPA: hypothetical protein VMR21_10895 [Vicinamibacteria bacterium]|nr:hypothetical protein [Vicinamibacteria bacterium]
MKRSLAVTLLLALLVPGCRSAGPRRAGLEGPAGADPLRAYVGDVRIFRSKGDDRSLTLKPGQRPAGGCDLAVHVRAARFEKDGARFDLDTVGQPSVSGQRSGCRKVAPSRQLLLAGLGPRTDVAARVEGVLQSPEAYLRSRGVAFDRPAGQPPREIASPDVSAASAERVLGLKVEAWPRVLLAVDPYFHDPSGRVRQQSEVEFEAVVGTDGRLYQPRLTTALSRAQQELVLSTLSRWRYDPARTASAPVAARSSARTALRIE